MIPQSLEKLSLAGKVAVVTGGTQGLGEAIAHMLAERGAEGLVICGRNEANGERVKAALEAKGAKTVYLAADLAQVEDCRAIVAAAEKSFGRRRPGQCRREYRPRHDLGHQPRAFRPHHGRQSARALLPDAGGRDLDAPPGIRGSIVNIISMSGHGGQPFITAYCASKGALITLTKNVAFGVMRHGIRVNGLCIGWMDTPGEDRVMRQYHGAGMAGGKRRKRCSRPAVC
jgi:Dehydrogenases with different specificities (related to short-chain alcohol dehydrogenases)